MNEEFNKAMKAKYPKLNMERATRIFGEAIARIVPSTGGDSPSDLFKTVLGSDLFKHVVLSVVDKYVEEMLDQELDDVLDEDEEEFDYMSDDEIKKAIDKERAVDEDGNSHYVAHTLGATTTGSFSGPFGYRNLKHLIREELNVDGGLDDVEDPDFDLDDLSIRWPEDLHSEGIPKDDDGHVSIESANELYADQKIEFENYEIIELTDTNFKICCGGDWELPKLINMERINNELTVISSEFVQEIVEGMGNDEFIRLLNEEHNKYGKN